MNNSVQTIKSNSVDMFLQSRLENVNTRAFWMPAQSTNSTTTSFNIGGIEKIFITPEEARKTNNTTLIGLSIAGATVLTAAGIFFFLKGGPKGIFKGFRKLSAYLENKILNSKLNTGVAPNKTLLYLLNMTRNASSRAEAINNFTTFKDVLFKKIMGLTRFTDGIHGKITELFGKIGRKAVTGTYRSTAEKFKQISVLGKSLSPKLLGQNPSELVEINGVTMTRAKWAEKVAELDRQISAEFNANFADAALKGRLSRMKYAVSTLYDKFKKMGVFWSRDTLTKFMAESTVAREKLLIRNGVNASRNSLSYGLSDMLVDSNSKILEIAKVLGYKDSKNIGKLSVIKANIKTYVNGSAKNEVLKEQIIDNVASLKREVETLIKNKAINPEDAKSYLAKFDELSDGIKNFKEGKIESILSIYKKLLPEDEYDIISHSYKRCIKSLDKSIRTETEDYMSKLRDLTLGSAPTDIVTMLSSLGVLGYHLGKSKDSDQRQSIALKYGFPALAGIGVSLYCNAKLFAGSKSLVVGAVSTWLLNRIGDWGDKKLKEMKRGKEA